MPTSRLASSMLKPRTWLLCAAAVALAAGCNDSSGLKSGDAGPDAKHGTDARTGTDAGMPGGTGGSSGTGGSIGTGGTRGSGGSSGTGGQPGTTCQEAGGSCVAVYPGACASGAVVNISCGPGVGTQCCMRGGNGGSSGTGGTRASGGSSGAGGTRGSGGSSGAGGQPGTTCQQAGGSCVAVYPGACPSGNVVDFSCGAGFGTECCMPGSSRDAGIDSGTQTLAELCTATGGVVTTGQCCASASDFPQTCAVGACGCSPSASKNISMCSCSAGCFSQSVGCTTR